MAILEKFERKVPLTPDELKQHRKNCVDFYIEEGHPFPFDFTCDHCELANICTLAFDLYNLDGDCLLEK